jgi:hypothetical protein
MARTLVNGRDVELWEADRKVAMISHEGAPSPKLTRDGLLCRLGPGADIGAAKAKSGFVIVQCRRGS